MENKGHQPRTFTGALHFGGTWPANKFVHHSVRRGLWCSKFSDVLVTYGWRLFSESSCPRMSAQI